MSFDAPADSSNVKLPAEMEIPVLAIRNTVIFPGLVFPISVGRARSVVAVVRAVGEPAIEELSGRGRCVVFRQLRHGETPAMICSEVQRHIDEGRLGGAVSVRDESSGRSTLVVVELRPGTDAEAIKQRLMSHMGHSRAPAYLGVFAQRDPKTDRPDPSDLYQVGTIVEVLRYVEKQKHNVVIKGLARARVKEWLSDGDFLSARLQVYQEPAPSAETLDMMETLRELAQRIIELSPHINNEAQYQVRTPTEPGVLADIVATNLSISSDEKQELLETFDTQERMQKVIALLNKDISIMEVSNKIQTDVKGEMDKAQREYFLREQMKAIQRELGEVDERQEEFEELKRNIKRAKMPKDVEEVAFKELKRMARMSPGAAEYTVSRTYIDWLTELPWSNASVDRHDVVEAEKILDADHFGLEKVKQRILEAEGRHEGPDPVFGRPPRRRQDVAREVGRPRARPEDAPDRARWRARRGRDPRTPPHVHRIDAR